MNELFESQLVIKQFNKAATTYDDAAVIQKTAADVLFDRIEIIKFNSTKINILDLGAGTGYCTKKLVKQFPDANVVALDLSEKMLAKIDSQNVEKIVAPAEHIPVQDNRFDLIVSNMMLHWSTNVEKVFSEIYRILKKDGLFLYTTLGPDTLHELRHSWEQIDNYNHVHHFYDMHDLGDAMLRAGFHDPVMDMQVIDLRYQNLKQLFQDFKQLGVRNLAEPRKRGLTTKKQYLKLLEEYEKFKIDNYYPATYEIIFGHAWGKKIKQKPGEFRVSIDDILKG